MNKSQQHLIIELAAKERVFTTAQAKRYGISRDALSKACKTGYLRRLRHGAYCFSVFEDTPENILLATWKLTNPSSYSDERLGSSSWDGIAVGGLSAAYMNGFFDSLNTPFVFCTPKRFNSRKKDAIYRTRDIDYGDIVVANGIPYTAPERTLVDLIIDSDSKRFSHTDVARAYQSLSEKGFDSTRFKALLDKETPDDADEILSVLTDYNGEVICNRCWNYAIPDEKLRYCKSCKEKRHIKQGTVGVVAITVLSGIIYAILRNGDNGEYEEVEIEDLDSFNEDYDVPDDFMSAKDHAKLEEALSSGHVYSHIADAFMYELKTGKLTVDDFLRGQDASSIVDQYPDWRDSVSSLTDDQFARAAQRAADDIDKVKKIHIDSDGVIHATIESNSGKQTWGASFDFSDEKDGSHSSDCRYSSDYFGAGVPLQFINSMRKWLKFEVNQNIELNITD